MDMEQGIFCPGVGKKSFWNFIEINKFKMILTLSRGMLEVYQLTIIGLEKVPRYFLTSTVILNCCKKYNNVWPPLWPQRPSQFLLSPIQQHLQCNAMLLVVYKVNSTRTPISNQWHALQSAHSYVAYRINLALYSYHETNKICVLSSSWDMYFQSFRIWHC